MLKNKAYSLLFSFTLLFVLVGFQNCSPVAFNSKAQIDDGLGVDAQGDPTEPTPIICEGDEVRNIESNTCELNCDEPLIANSETRVCECRADYFSDGNKCEPIKTCEGDEKLNEETNTCELTCEQPLVANAETKTCECRADYFSDGNKCEPIKTCEGDEKLNEETNTCELTCEQPLVANAETKTCECRADYFSDGNKCEPIKTCEGDEKLNEETNTCELTCEQPLVANAETKTCECPDGTITGDEPNSCVTPTPTPTPYYPFKVKVNTEKVYEKVDILFVLDESVSMDRVLSKFNNGFASIQDPDLYPNDTLMSVTYMSPAYVDTNDVPDFTKAFFTSLSGISSYPGFMQLVNKSTIDAFKNSSESYQGQDKFALQGCANQWFTPLENNSDSSASCLRAHTQIPLTATQLEAGVTTFHQLIQRGLSDYKKVFRDESVANVVFVSDTHDHGWGQKTENQYYSQAGAPSQRATYSKLLLDTQELHNNKLSGLKFSAIAPLPAEANAPELEGVNVIGELGGEFAGENNKHEYSYLPYVKASGGVAMHPAQPNDDFKPALIKLLEDAVRVEAPLIPLEESCPYTIAVLVDGSLLSESDFELQDNGELIKITKDPLPVGEVEVEVRCEN